MKYYDTNYQTETIFSDSLTSNTNYHNSINERSDFISSNNCNTGSLDLYHFTSSAEKMLNEGMNISSHTMLVFGIDNFSDIHAFYGHAAGNELLNYVRSTLNSYLSRPNLYCQLQSDSFAVFLENYKDVDLALLAIQLTEEISNFNAEYKTKLSFGICKASPIDLNISSLCSRALFAKRTLKMKAPQLLADYNEIVRN